MELADRANYQLSWMSLSAKAISFLGPATQEIANKLIKLLLSISFHGFTTRNGTTEVD